MSGTVTASSRDPFELTRLAEELAAREATSRPERLSTSVDLPELLPLSHDNENLTAPDFNVEDFLLSRSNMSLPDLRAELREYLAKLKEELVKLINDDYEAFISLSTDLQGEGDRLERIKWPLGDLHSRIQDSRSQLQGVQDSVQAKLDRRATLREEKAMLQLLLKISDSITRLESLLLISSPQEGNPPGQSSYLERCLSGDDITDDKSTKGKRAKHLLRIATEYNQLLYHTNKASKKNCSFVAESQWRIERIKSTLSSDLEHHFAITLLSLTSNDKTSAVAKARQPETEHAKLLSDLVDCLRAYDMLGLWRDAEDIIRREVVRGFVKKTIFPGCLSGPLSPVMPHTPLVQQPPGASLFSRPPPTPYTPYTALPSKQNPFFANVTDLDSSIYLLDDSDSPLAGVYNQVLRFIARDMKPIMEAAEQVASKSRQKSSVLSVDITNAEGSTEYGFDILSNVIWAEVSRAIMDDLGSSVFAAGKPDEFRKNYETTQAFIRSIEYLAPSIHSVKALRVHHSFGTFERRWQLPVYFQLRWKDIVSRVEEALESKSLSPTTSNTKSGGAETALVLSQSRAILNALSQCWSPEIYMLDLAPRFWRLTLQLIKRYRTWIESNLPSLENLDKMKSPLTDKVASSGLPGSRSSTPTLPQDNSSVDRTAEDDKCLLQCAVLLRDLKGMEQVVQRLWREQTSSMLPHSSMDTNEEETGEPENALKSALSFVTEIVPSLSSQVELILTNRCCDALAPVKSLPGQFRATSQKHMPTKPSSFVPLILRPVKLFFGIDTGEGPAKALRNDFCAPISTNVVEPVSNKYLQHLSAMRKTEESLRRLRMGKRTGFSLFGGGSSSTTDDDARDEERVRAQLILDVKAFAKDAEALGVNLDNCSSFRALERSVHANEGEPEVS
ncbi:COG complex component [Fomitiporia mediterranea MF3/22]|uniref:COG complex component n=1 Tax=Fomitiporia mediterranea (strain MF3/22) TaxID=694068 RepID=UPI0004408EBC|nr:COG complex component [Fomitiporia mediterranea MF3/22]EJD02931.1 COG complex component [Fomitiporia mediterranea MF3/22]